MIYIISLIMVIFLSSVYFYLKPTKKATKNIYNAEYYRGLNYLLNNEEDKAFKIFAALMDVDSSTIETHLALGGLYRKRGEFDKAILIHQNLLARPTLETELKNQALYELAKDFYSAGLYDRSERIFNNLSEIKSYKQSSLEYLIKIYESTKEWERAIDLTKTIDSKFVNDEKTNSLLAQYYCEISSSYKNQNQIEKAIAISKKALKTNTACIRANLQLAKYYSQNDVGISAQYYNAVIMQDKLFAPFIAYKIIQLAKRMDNSSMVIKTLISIAEHKDIPFLSEIYYFILYEKDDISAKKYIDSFDVDDPINNFMISHVLASSDNNDKTDGIMNNMITSYENIFNTNFYFVCNNCGYKSNTLNWKCPSCNRWETMLPKSAIDVIRDGKINEPNKEK